MFGNKVKRAAPFRSLQTFGLDLAAGNLQIPIAAKIGMTRVIIRGGNISTGCFGKCREGRLVLPEVTPVDQDIRTVGERTFNRRKLIRVVAIDAGRVQRGIAKGDLTRGAMRQDMNGIQIAAPVEDRGDLDKPVGTAIQYYNLGPVGNRSDQIIGIVDA